MKKVIQLLVLAVFSCISYLSFAHDGVVHNKELCLEGTGQCTFVLLSEKASTNSSIIINSKRAATQVSPFSSFKVANSLIALDKGLIQDAKQILTFNKEQYPVQAWWPSAWKLPQYNLFSAFKYSMVAIYRQLAKQIGQADMDKYINRLHYGNQDTSSGLDDFWLNGSMKISANEQVEFLQKLYHNKFGFKVSAVNTLKEVMLVESTEKYKLYAKTGAGKVNDGSMLGWYVGFVENTSGVHFFAFNLNRDSYAQMKAVRISIAKNHLKQADII